MLYVLLLTVLENVLVCFTCLQHMFPVFVLHHIDYHFLLNNFTFSVLLLTIVFVQRRFFKFLFLQKHLSSGTANMSLNSLFTCKMFQCFFTASFTFDKVQLKVKVNGILYLVSLFCVSRSSLSLSNVFEMLSYISAVLYPLSISFSTKYHNCL